MFLLDPFNPKGFFSPDSILLALFPSCTSTIVTTATWRHQEEELVLLQTLSLIEAKGLNGLAILSIEKDMVEKLEYKNLISNFSSQKARKIYFK